jgi:cytidyltransferase-like protein
MTSLEYGVVLGRFQPLHVGHMEYLDCAKARCDRLIVGVTNPDTSSLQFHPADPNRSKLESNPFSYFLRYEMIDAALRGLGWLPGSYGIVPADLEALAVLRGFLPPPDRTTIFVTVYDAWGEEKADRLGELGYPVEVLWRRDMSQRVTSGTALRRAMRENGTWRELVPEGVAAQIDRLGALRVVGLIGDSGQMLTIREVSA